MQSRICDGTFAGGNAGDNKVEESRERERERVLRREVFLFRSKMEVTGGGEYVVGCRLAIKTTLGEDIEGAVLAYDNSSKIVVIHIFLSDLIGSVL